MEQKEITKTRLIIYVLMAYGLTCLMGILMWYGSTKGYDLTVFPTAQMMYPCCGQAFLQHYDLISATRFTQPHSVPHKAFCNYYKNADGHGYIVHTQIL